MKRIGRYERFERTGKRGRRYYFRLVAGNGEIVGHCQAYKSPEARDKGIRSMRFNAPLARVVDVED